MPRFRDTLNAWGSEAFAATLRGEIENLPLDALPIAREAARGYVYDDPIAATVVAVKEQEDRLEATVGLFFREVVAGCSCGDDPAFENAYCELRVTIDKASAEAAFLVVP